MAIITLTTDLGTRDHYLGSVKGLIYSMAPNTTVVDISHDIRPYHIGEAAFILRNAYHYFPKGTYHLISVDSDPSQKNDIIMVQYKEHFFVGHDNGIISLITDSEAGKIIKLNVTAEEEMIFPLLNVMARAVCKLARKQSEYEIGKPVKEMRRSSVLHPIIEQSVIRGTVIYIDNFGNAITNISKKQFNRFGENPEVTVHCSGKYRVDKISKHYKDVSEGEILCLFGSSGLLEIAMNNGDVSKLANITLNSKIIVEFSR